MQHKTPKAKYLIGWTTFIITLSIISFWSYWGINENFHEGWYHISLLQNLSLAFIQYLSIPLILFAISSIALFHKKIGVGLIITLGVFALFFFNNTAGRIFIFTPLMLLALGFYFGEFRRKKAFLLISIMVPLLIIFSFGIPQIIRVEGRFNDNDFGMRIIEGNNVRLAWAPQGIGFPLSGTDWETAKSNCERLNSEGTGLETQEVYIWRLPTREEIVRSMTRHNENAMGYLDGETAHYETTPDKETPLWNPHSQVIYYWTSEQKNEERAYLVAYNGYILARNKYSGANYQGYRCVK